MEDVSMVVYMPCAGARLEVAEVPSVETYYILLMNLLPGVQNDVQELGGTRHLLHGRRREIASQDRKIFWTVRIVCGPNQVLVFRNNFQVRRLQMSKVGDNQMITKGAVPFAKWGGFRPKIIIDLR